LPAGNPENEEYLREAHAVRDEKMAKVRKRIDAERQIEQGLLDQQRRELEDKNALEIYRRSRALEL
jgi:two-component sensor histidine kinase